MKYIMVEKTGSGYALHDDDGHKELFVFYSKRDAVRVFKQRYGYKYKRNVVIIEI